MGMGCGYLTRLVPGDCHRLWLRHKAMQSPRNDGAKLTPVLIFGALVKWEEIE